VSVAGGGGREGRPGRVGSRGRRGRRPKTHAAVLAATTELLETVPLAELSVAQILDAADVGRTSFYEHFSSKDDVVVKLLRAVSTDIAREIEPMFARGDRSPEEAFHEGLTRLIRMWERYAPLMVTGSVEWPSIPELRRLWLRIHADLTRRIAAVIAADRASGLAPPGADPQGLAAALVWSTERALLVSRTGGVAALPGPEALVEPLTQLYVRSIYGDGRA
jgi:TetR/AcrR family transcriptional regulator, ethionamide resistance regulator